MIKGYSAFLLVFFFFFQPNKKKGDYIYEKNKSLYNPKLNTIKINKCIPEINFKKIEILQLKKKIDPSSSDDDTTKCTNWHLTKKQIKKIMIASTSISQEDLHHQFDYLSCSYYGQLKYKDKKYNFSVNSGSWFKINLKDTALLYGCYDKKVVIFFLSEPNK